MKQRNRIPQVHEFAKQKSASGLFGLVEGLMERRWERKIHKLIARFRTEDFFDTKLELQKQLMDKKKGQIVLDALCTQFELENEGLGRMFLLIGDVINQGAEHLNLDKLLNMAKWDNSHEDMLAARLLTLYIGKGNTLAMDTVDKITELLKKHGETSDNFNWTCATIKALRAAVKRNHDVSAVIPILVKIAVTQDIKSSPAIDALDTLKHAVSVPASKQAALEGFRTLFDSNKSDVVLDAILAIADKADMLFVFPGLLEMLKDPNCESRKLYAAIRIFTKKENVSEIIDALAEHINNLSATDSSWRYHSIRHIPAALGLGRLSNYMLNDDLAELLCWITDNSLEDAESVDKLTWLISGVLMNNDRAYAAIATFAYRIDKAQETECRMITTVIAQVTKSATFVAQAGCNSRYYVATVTAFAEIMDKLKQKEEVSKHTKGHENEA